jgi:hypothetical protein
MFAAIKFPVSDVYSWKNFQKLSQLYCAFHATAIGDCEEKSALWKASSATCNAILALSFHARPAPHRAVIDRTYPLEHIVEVFSYVGHWLLKLLAMQWLLVIMGLL